MADEKKQSLADVIGVVEQAKAAGAQTLEIVVVSTKPNGGYVGYNGYIGVDDARTALLVNGAGDGLIAASRAIAAAVKPNPNPNPL